MLEASVVVYLLQGHLVSDAPEARPPALASGLPPSALQGLYGSACSGSNCV